MEQIAIEDVDAWEDQRGSFRGLSDALGTTDLAVNHYERAPGTHR